jgi:hypothetical protein
MSTVPDNPLEHARRFEVDDSLAQVFDFFDRAYADGWTDGRPVFPPVAEKVTARLHYTDRDPQDVVGIIAARNGAATVETIAINAVMAGGRQGHMNFIPTLGDNLSATRPITRKDGGPIRHMADFIR